MPTWKVNLKHRSSNRVIDVVIDVIEVIDEIIDVIDVAIDVLQLVSKLADTWSVFFQSTNAIYRLIPFKIQTFSSKDLFRVIAPKSTASHSIKRFKRSDGTFFQLKKTWIVIGWLASLNLIEVLDAVGRSRRSLNLALIGHLTLEDPSSSNILLNYYKSMTIESLLITNINLRVWQGLIS